VRATSPRLLLVWSIGVVGLFGCDPPFPVQPTGTVHPVAPVQILTEPDAGAGAVLDLISSAHASLWMEMYLLTDDRAIAGLIGRAAAGCDVRVILEPAPYEDAGANQPAFDQLAAAGVEVRWSTARFSYTHAKAFSLDHTRLVVLTLNLTAAGLGGNREYVAIDDDPTDVAASEALFAADRLGATTGATGGRLVTSPESTRPTTLALIAGARTSLTLETEELTDRQIVGGLVAARGRGVAVTVVWPGPASDGGTSFTMLTDAGAVVRIATAPPIHGKVTVVDDRALYVGSANLTPTSLDDNREIGLLLEQAATASAVGGTVAADAAGGS
jgi:cardiolipin synthase A/B